MSEKQTTLTVYQATYDLLRKLGLTTIFGNPGSTEQPFLKNFPADFECVLGLQEATAVAMADGVRSGYQSPTSAGKRHPCFGLNLHSWWSSPSASPEEQQSYGLTWARRHLKPTGKTAKNGKLKPNDRFLEPSGGCGSIIKDEGGWLLHIYVGREYRFQ